MKLSKILFATIAVALLASCNSKPKTEPVDPELIQFEQEKEQKSQIIKLGDYTASDDVQAGGHSYHYTIERQALDTLGVITNDEGFRAYDNRLTLSVQRDGAPLYNTTLVRSQFRPYMDADDYRQYVLMNIVFDRALVGGDLRFIVSLGDAADGGEIFVQFALTIHVDGTSTITYHEMYDEDEIDRFSDDGV